MNYNIRQQGPNVYEGLFSLIGSIMGNKARERGEIKNYQAQQDFNDQINALDYGGQTSIQDLASRSNPNSNYTNKTASTQAQGLLPTGFSQSAPTSDTIGQGLLSMQKPQIEQQPQRFFADPNIATDMQPDTTPLLGKYAKENNPVNITTSAPKTLQEQTRMIKSQQATAMKELVGKGYHPKDILPLLQQATNDKITELNATYQQNQVNELYNGFVNEENPNKKAMYAARLKQAGYDVTTPYKEFAPTYQSEKINTGGQQLGLSFNPKTGKYEQQFIVDNTVSPDAQLSANARLQAAAMRGSGGGGGSRSSSGNGGSGARSQATEKPDGPGTKNGKRLDPLEKAKYAELYNQKLEDIWDSATPEIRAQKIQQHSQDLNELGYYMDRDVQNDLDAITGG